MPRPNRPDRSERAMSNRYAPKSRLLQAAQFLVLLRKQPTRSTQPFPAQAHAAALTTVTFLPGAAALNNVVEYRQCNTIIIKSTIRFTAAGPSRKV